jgi:hypothetical protein
MWSSTRGTDLGWLGSMDEIIRSDAIGWSCGFRLMNNTPIRTRPGRVGSHQLASE